MPKYIKLIAISLAMALTISGCKQNGDSGDNPPVMVDRIALNFAPSEYETACTNPNTMVLNYLYLLSKGDYAAALDYCIIPEGVVFNEIALQKCVLAEGIGRGESITFFRNDVASNFAQIEYDLAIGANSSTYNKMVKINKNSRGAYGVDIEASGYIAKGSLEFGVPKYVKAYINDVEVDQKYLDANYYYHINQGISKLPTTGTTSDTSTTTGEGTTSNATPKVDITLRLDTKFGISQEYPLVFQGQATKSRKSVNDNYYRASNDLSVFKIDVPREKRESALNYIQTQVIPSLMHDILNGTDWDDATFKKLLGEGSDTNAMFSDYYKASTTFADATMATEGKYYFYDFNSYNFEISDKKAESYGYPICVSDYNVMDIYITCDYNYLYTRGSDEVKRNATGSLRGLVQLSVDKDGNWYLHDLDSNLFKISLA